MKKLITAIDIRRAAADNVSHIDVPASGFIITPEAQDLAHQAGISIAPQSTPLSKVSAEDPVATIKAAIEAKIGTVNDGKSAHIQQLIQQALADFNLQAPESPRQINDDGIMLVRGQAVTLGSFDGAPGKNVGLTDVITADDGSNMGVGYMGWENAFFPWTLCYDEVNVVLEGELHVKTASGTTIAKPSDVIFIPKGSTVEFGTPTRVRYVYITYPADWG
ncbi:ethanolamine utilization acetate kinase EutQ [Ferrimonas lipolytica]|uniref:Ethanolamine utilization acetate kinase EutQ n=1 Tax=Ferrimonas lipolytica TaxID=2724191 RepID=A0A6H1U9I1_9GAMM|nr:ethanolamine utilization acetate kinase EutQ [Ferrimonas lipolytica]QIZ75705.1 ethanolamine utilization acetate kinase EutQ [Ferrimonas lipolytica]